MCHDFIAFDLHKIQIASISCQCLSKYDLDIWYDKLVFICFSSSILRNLELCSTCSFFARISTISITVKHVKMGIEKSRLTES